jgi:DHA2 family multidrug resistance protein
MANANATSGPKGERHAWRESIHCLSLSFRRKQGSIFSIAERQSKWIPGSAHRCATRSPGMTSVLRLPTPMASNAATATQPLGDFRPASLPLATIGLSLGTFMQVLDMTIANVSLPTIAGNLGASQDQSTWVITSFTVAQAITLPMTGFLSRRFGEVKVFVWAVLLFSLFSLACGFATSLSMLVLFRAMQGAVCGPMYPITQSLMVSIYPREKRGMALAIISMITVVAPIVGPVAGGWITDSYSWRWIFFINVPCRTTAQGAHRLGGRDHVDPGCRLAADPA